MAFTGAMPSDNPAMPQSFLMIGAFPQSNGQIIAEFRVSDINGTPEPGTSFTYKGRRYITTEVTQDYSRRECIVKAIHYPDINTDIYPDYEDNEIRDKNGETVAVVRTEKQTNSQWLAEQYGLRLSFMERQMEQRKNGITDAAEYNAQMGKSYSGILADAARQRKQQMEMQQERFSQRVIEELMEKTGLVVKPAEPAPKPAVKPKPDPFPTAKRIIKLKD